LEESLKGAAPGPHPDAIIDAMVEAVLEAQTRLVGGMDDEI
jgi:hypothetical protein